MAGEEARACRRALCGTATSVCAAGMPACVEGVHLRQHGRPGCPCWRWQRVFVEVRMSVHVLYVPHSRRAARTPTHACRQYAKTPPSSRAAWNPTTYSTNVWQSATPAWAARRPALVMAVCICQGTYVSTYSICAILTMGCEDAHAQRPNDTRDCPHHGRPGTPRNTL